MHKKIYIAIVVVIFFIAIVVSQLLFSKGNIFEQQMLIQQIELKQKQIDSLNTVIEERKLIIERLQNDSLYKEEILRTRYGMSRKDEKVFQMVK
ncbi:MULTISPECIES: septum formation initiator family protein [unclassified Fibrobacter]|uniref:FtsB family cell division protein n=1 Tax=unclassified Fibrobacter TaxID=2634177 RepID=UPI0015677B9D|nr:MULTISPECIES: septum formation initiator family protein [unclassified Fibrobacter]